MKDKSMTATEWMQRNVKDTESTLSEDSARLFSALSIGGNLASIKVAGGEQMWKLCSIE